MTAKHCKSVKHGSGFAIAFTWIKTHILNIKHFIIIRIYTKQGVINLKAKTSDQRNTRPVHGRQVFLLNPAQETRLTEESPVANLQKGKTGFSTRCFLTQECSRKHQGNSDETEGFVKRVFVLERLYLPQCCFYV